MELSPRLYQRLVRPKCFTKFFIHNVIQNHFDFTNQTVLDFGSGIGSNCSIFHPDSYLGLEVDQKRIDYANCLYPKYRFQAILGNHLPVSDDSIDYILIIAVLHHIPTAELPGYLQEFHRILKPGGKIIGIEPCYFDNSHFSNWFMRQMDKGKYIQNESGYCDMFRNYEYNIHILKRFKKLSFYNELFFSAVPKVSSLSLFKEDKGNDVRIQTGNMQTRPVRQKQFLHNSGRFMDSS